MDTDAREEYNQMVRRNNERFEAMSPSRKRIEIARDVLRQIRAGRIQPRVGTYFNARLAKTTTVKPESEFSKVVEKVERCEACALGAVFMCTVQRADALKAKQLGWSYDDRVTPREVVSISSGHMRDYLKGFFSMDQILLIELAFEGSVIAHSDIMRYNPAFTGEQYEECRLFNGGRVWDRDGVKSSTTRMENIMRNIEHHGGRFEPSDRSLNKSE